MNRIRELRERKNISMREAAQALGLPYTTYVNYEKGDREPNSEMLIALADFYETSIDYMIGRDVPYSYGSSPDANIIKLSKDDDILLQSFHQISEEGKIWLLEYLDTLIKSGKYSKKAQAGGNLG